MLRYLCCNLFSSTDPVNEDMAIQKTILNGVLEAKPIEEVDQFITTKYGPNAIEYQELDYWYWRFYNGKKAESYDRDLYPTRKTLSELPDDIILKIVDKLDVDERIVFGRASHQFRDLPDLKNLTVRKIILCGVVNKKSIEEVDKFICKGFGEEAISYSDLDFFYYRFYNGKCDLEYDRSLDPTPLQFSQLPSVVIREIQSELMVKDRINLKKISKKMNRLVDTRCQDITAYVKEDFMQIFFAKDGKVQEIVVLRRRLYERLQGVLGVPDIKLNSLDLINSSLAQDGFEEEISTMDTLFKSLKSPIHLKNLFLKGYHPVALSSILPYLKPGVLTSIVFKCRTYDRLDEVIRLASGMEQWKKTKKLIIDMGRLATRHHLIQYLFHFSNFELVGRVNDQREILWIRALLAQSDSLDSFHAQTSLKFSEFCHHLCTDIVVKKESETDGLAEWVMPHTGTTFHITMTGDHIHWKDVKISRRRKSCA